MLVGHPASGIQTISTHTHRPAALHICTAAKTSPQSMHAPNLVGSRSSLSTHAPACLQNYYTTPNVKGEARGYWCHACYSERGDHIEMEGSALRKTELEKKRNDEETEEGWVQCDQCERWVHQICGLFNKGRNTESTNYLCPHCLKHGALVALLSRLAQLS